MIGLLLLLATAPLAEADSAMARRDYDAAVAAYRARLAVDSGSYEARFGLARALSFSGHRDEAIAEYSTLLAAHPGDADALLGRGRVYAWMQKWEESERDLFDVTSRHPDYADAWAALGDLYLWSARPDSALAAYAEWESLRSEDAAPVLGRAKVHRAARRFPEARGAAEEARLRGGSAEEIDAFLRGLDRIPAALPWEVSLSYNLVTFSPDRPDWNTYNGSIRREFTRGSVGLEWFRSRRFSKWDEGGAVDVYWDLWRRAYGNFRYQAVPDAAVMARSEELVEIFQGFGKGWEASVGYRHMDFGPTGADIYNLSLARYIGNWYLRTRTTGVPATGGQSLSQSVSIRRYFSTVDDFLEISGGIGRKDEQLAGRAHEKTHSHNVGLRGETYFTKHLGASLSGSYSDEEDQPVSRSVTAGLSVRW